MKTYRNKNTQKQCTETVLSSMGFSLNNVAILNKAGWYEIDYSYPSYDIDTERFEPDGDPVWDEESQKFIQNFKVISLTQEELASIREMKEQEAMSKLREIRDKRLSETDYLLMVDYPISEENLAEVKQYRQALRDLPQQEGAPWLDGEIPWPALPEFLNN